MRNLMIIFCLSLGVVSADELDLNDRGDAERALAADNIILKENQLEADFQDRKGDLRDLRLAKYYLIAGDVAKAERYLDRVASAGEKLSEIVTRYRALTTFVQDDFASTYDLLKSERLNLISSYEEICLMRIVSMIALGPAHPDHRNLEREFDSCRLITFKYSPNEHFWLSSMKLLSQKNFTFLPGSKLTEFTRILSTVDTTKLWLKLSLYTGREKNIIENLSLVPEEYYSNIGLRELLGMAYYRQKDYDRAQSFIEDLSSPNADNIRGDIALRKNEWEIAYGHFRLALKRKDDSINALERAIPLSWLLGLHEDSLELISRYVGDEYDPIKLLALETAIRIRTGEYKQADDNLRYLSSKLLGASPLDIEIMRSFVGLMREDLSLLKESSSKACRAFDGLNCWISDQLLVWDDLTKTIKRNDEINIAAQPLSRIIQDLSDDTVTLKEKILVDQRDIEELDSREVKLQIN